MVAAVTHGSTHFEPCARRARSGRSPRLRARSRCRPADAKMLSKDEVEPGGPIPVRSGRQRFVAGRSILRRLVGFYLDGSPAESSSPTARRGSRSSRTPALSFNVAHSGRCALFAFAPGLRDRRRRRVARSALAARTSASPSASSRPEVATLRAHATPGSARGVPPLLDAEGGIHQGSRRGTEPAAAGLRRRPSPPGERPAVLRTAWSAEEPAEWTLHDISNLCRGAPWRRSLPAPGAAHRVRRANRLTIERRRT